MGYSFLEEVKNYGWLMGIFLAICVILIIWTGQNFNVLFFAFSGGGFLAFIGFFVMIVGFGFFWVLAHQHV